MLITSLTNPRVKAAVKLRDRKGRQEQGRIVIDGIREIALAIEAGVKIAEQFVCDELASDEERQLVKRAVATGAQPLDVTLPVMEELAFGQRVEGVLAVAETPHKSLPDLDVGRDQSAAGRRRPTGDHPLLAVLEGIEKPGNL